MKWVMVLVVSLMVGTLMAATMPTMWECNYCHQQYVGDQPPRFVKCPAKDMKQGHWWIKKH